MRRAKTETDYRARTLRAQECLDRAIANGQAIPPPADLARVAAFSLHHFHRVFRGVTGESVEEYCRRIRLERAAKRIRAGANSILETALDAGYESHEGFSRAFHRHFGVSPSAYRNELPARFRREIAPPEIVEIREEQAIPVFFIRNRGSWANVSSVFRTLIEWAIKRGIDPRETRLFGRCPDDPDVTPEPMLRFDACIAAPPNMANAILSDTTSAIQRLNELHGANEEANVAAGIIPAGLYAIGGHKGSYSRLGDTYVALIGGWLPTTAYSLCPEPVVEAYLNDPQITPETGLRTEVRIRLEEIE